METKDFQNLLIAYHRRLAHTPLNFKRSLYDKINWDARLIGIKGERGVGKTTLILQHLKETVKNPDEAMYASLDNLWFTDNSLSEFVEFLYSHGIRTIYFDEVHKCKNWLTYLKNFYDDYPDLKIVYTGSAMLQIDYSLADLSRRQSLYTLNGLSFREYLQYQNIIDVPPIELKDLVRSHSEYTSRYSKEIPVLKYFDEYLHFGYYPYFKEAGKDFLIRVSDSARTVIETDIPSVENINYSSVEKIKKLLMVIAQSVPFEINLTRLAEQMESTRDQTLKMLSLLGRSGLLNIFGENIRDYKHLSGPKKIYLGNTNLMQALSENITSGTVRETFFANQLDYLHTVTIPKKGDFQIDGKYLFEVGGRKKSYNQIADMPDSYLAVDDIEIGFGNRIPLWAFGCLY